MRRCVVSRRPHAVHDNSYWRRRSHGRRGLFRSMARERRQLRGSLGVSFRIGSQTPRSWIRRQVMELLIWKWLLRRTWQGRVVFCACSRAVSRPDSLSPPSKSEHRDISGPSPDRSWVDAKSTPDRPQIRTGYTPDTPQIHTILKCCARWSPKRGTTQRSVRKLWSSTPELGSTPDRPWIGPAPTQTRPSAEVSPRCVLHRSRIVPKCCI